MFASCESYAEPGLPARARELLNVQIPGAVVAGGVLIGLSLAYGEAGPTLATEFRMDYKKPEVGEGLAFVPLGKTVAG